MGIFERVRTALELPTVRLALLELSKGKLTTDPARHTGGGVFFTSRAMALFALCANGLAYQRERVADGVQTLERIDDDADAVRTGTQAGPGHKQSGGLFVPGEGLGLWPGAACKAGG